jgi:ribose 1,5-bisphosphate isomerase
MFAPQISMFSKTTYSLHIMLLDETANKIKSMEIRGAGRIARAAVEAMKDYAQSIRPSSTREFHALMNSAALKLLATRPTAVSLPNAIHFVLSSLPKDVSIDVLRTHLIDRANMFINDSKDAIKRIGEIGSKNISDGDVILTHCNSEAALACIITAFNDGKKIEVFATEVRPGNQGLITIKTLNDAGIPTSYIVDSAARHFINNIDLVIVGADAVTVNGAVINKIGTAQIALAAHEARTSFMVAAETYKFAPRTLLGEQILIEERDSSEILPESFSRSLPHVRVRNPVFDVTPPSYIDLICDRKLLTLSDSQSWIIPHF